MSNKTSIGAQPDIDLDDPVSTDFVASSFGSTSSLNSSFNSAAQSTTSDTLNSHEYRTAKGISRTSTLRNLYLRQPTLLGNSVLSNSISGKATTPAPNTFNLLISIQNTARRASLSSSQSNFTSTSSSTFNSKRTSYIEPQSPDSAISIASLLLQQSSLQSIENGETPKAQQNQKLCETELSQMLENITREFSLKKRTNRKSSYPSQSDYISVKFEFIPLFNIPYSNSLICLIDDIVSQVQQVVNSLLDFGIAICEESEKWLPGILDMVETVFLKVWESKWKIGLDSSVVNLLSFWPTKPISKLGGARFQNATKLSTLQQLHDAISRQNIIIRLIFSMWLTLLSPMYYILRMCKCADLQIRD
ncbi:hypothetical protein BKA69DRAFT_664017 [Paraphysoderma sedebokerense]|nr:hypothetical protein BKA69DRAFT_664017 [Paraphysoderma sedebokerense]